MLPADSTLLSAPNTQQFFRAHVLKETPFFSCGATPSRPLPKNPAPAGWASSTKMSSSEVPEREGFGVENCLRDGVDRENGKKDAQKEVGTSTKLTPGCGFFAYSWKLPAYSGAFLLTVDNFSFFAYSWSFFAHSFSFFTYSWSFFAYNGKVRLMRALRGCKQRSSTVSKKAPTVSKKASPN